MVSVLRSLDAQGLSTYIRVQSIEQSIFGMPVSIDGTSALLLRTLQGHRVWGSSRRGRGDLLCEFEMCHNGLYELSSFLLYG